MIRFAFLLLLIIPVNYAFVEHIFNSEAYAQYLDISQLESEKVTFDFDGKSYDIYYGVDTGYDLMKFPNDYVVGFIISENTKNIEIIGTRVIPEFAGLTILILAIFVMGIIYIAQKNPF